MGDGTVGVRQPNVPDRLIDNEVLTVAAQTVYRQRVQIPDLETMVGRLMNKQPKVGYSLWVDSTSTSYLYIAEAPSADAGTAATFNGIRLVKVTGGTNGKVMTATGFVWNDRATASWS